MKMEFSALKRRLYLPFYLVFLLLIATSTAWAVQRIKMLEGTLEIRSATYLDEKQSHPTRDVIEYAFRADDGAVYSLQFVDKVPAYLKTGQRLKIRDGQLLSPNADGTPEIMLLSKNITLIKDIKVSAIPDAFGNQTTIVMLVNFQDNPNDKPWTAGQVNDVVFNTLNNMYHEFSYNQTNVVGNVAGWFTIALNRGASCDSIRNSLPFMANEAAQRAGVDLSKYNRRVYMFPRNTNCTWAGLGSVGGKPSIAWLNGVNTVNKSQVLVARLQLSNPLNYVIDGRNLFLNYTFFRSKSEFKTSENIPLSEKELSPGYKKTIDINISFPTETGSCRMIFSFDQPWLGPTFASPFYEIEVK